MRWLDEIDGWDGGLPVALVTRCASVERRRTLLRDLAARALGRDAAGLTVLHREGRRPRLVPEMARTPRLSGASRGGWVALAMAPGPVGIDIEAVGIAEEIPWRVLHPAERRDLEALAVGDRAPAFAHLWTLKEAYLKALGLGLSRDPGSFRAWLGRGGAGRIEDPERPGGSARTWTTRRQDGAARLVASVVLLDLPQPDIGSDTTS